MSDMETKECLSCSRPEDVIPLVSLRYGGKEAWICSYCLPRLIHEPQSLVGKLAGADTIPVAEHED